MTTQNIVSFVTREFYLFHRLGLYDKNRDILQLMTSIKCAKKFSNF